MERKIFTKEFKLDVIQQSYLRSNIRELATELGIRPQLIYKCRAEFSRSWRRSLNPRRTKATRSTARECWAAHGTRHLKKGYWHLRQERWVTYQFMAEHWHEFPILGMSKVFNVSSSGYYRWLNAGSSKRTKMNQALTMGIKWDYDSGRNHGSSVNSGPSPTRAKRRNALSQWSK